MSLNVSAIFPERPVQDSGKRTVKSPLRIVLKLSRMMRSSGELSERDLGWPLAGTGDSAAEAGFSNREALRPDFFTRFSSLGRMGPLGRRTLHVREYPNIDLEGFSTTNTGGWP